MIKRGKSFSCQMAKSYWKDRFKESTGKKSLPRDITPLRYPGGKGSLKYFLANVVIANDLHGKFLIEPFCGGSGASLPLLFTGVIDRLYLNDANPLIYHFWWNVFFNTEMFVGLVRSCKVNMESWRYYKGVSENIENYSSLEVGFSAFFLNRCNRSGLLSAGPIGGVNQGGKYKMNCRFNKEGLIKRVLKISNFKEKVHISGVDACDFLENLEEDVLKDSLVFMDPPYVSQGRSLYKEFSFNDVGHENLAKYVKPKPWRWIITYDDEPLIHKLYAERAVGVIELSYLMQSAKIGRELLVAATHCRIPFPIYLEKNNKSDFIKRCELKKIVSYQG